MKKSLLLVLIIGYLNIYALDNVNIKNNQWSVGDVKITNVVVGTEDNPNYCAVFASEGNNWGNWFYFDATTSNGKNLLATALYAKNNDCIVGIGYLVITQGVQLNSLFNNGAGYYCYNKIIGISIGS